MSGPAVKTFDSDVPAADSVPETSPETSSVAAAPTGAPLT